jgi:hypothetical protein
LNVSCAEAPKGNAAISIVAANQPTRRFMSALPCFGL